MVKNMRAGLGYLRMALLVAMLAAFAGQQASACPGKEDCVLEGGSYRIALPPDTGAGAGKPGALVFFHGFQGSAEETMSDKGLADVAQRLGVALIAPHGLDGRWSFPGVGMQRRDELAYVEKVVADAVTRFGLDPDRMMASGFSLGGSMVWYLACRMPTRFRAFAPISGAFWEPLPADCAGPRPTIIHMHGLSDTTVPIAGREVRSGLRQGDLFKSLARIAPTCIAHSGPALTEGKLTCRLATGCDAARLEVCMHPGAHDYEAAWVMRAWLLGMEATQ